MIPEKHHGDYCSLGPNFNCWVMFRGSGGKTADIIFEYCPEKPRVWWRVE